MPPNSTGTKAAYPGSALPAGDKAGAGVPNQLPLKSFGSVPGTGIEPPAWRSTMPPYQLPEIVLPENVDPDDRCAGTLLPPLPSRNNTPRVQLSVIWFSVTTVSSVVFHRIMPVLLSSITLSRTTFPVLLLMSMAVRLPVSVLLRISARPLAFTETPAVLSGSFHVARALPARVIVKPSITTSLAVTRNVACEPPLWPTTVATPAPAPCNVTALLTATSSG